ncbi:MAG: phosphopantothenoylcysteine decarboxylase [Lentisphaerales bacterium]|jgi:phosphopantothenoylcysteine decarboxylase/phosphopantothenate--cysteine ligase|nr:MAG: phosphopantothenoylcysteine decarboxylase [Lentisphaerales bacterium]
MKILITAGPTREPIDPVRFISNRSSGKMGLALALTAIERGHEVALIAGPVSVDLSAIPRVITVETADDMLHAVRRELEWCDALVMAAAVADWRPAEVIAEKLKKNNMPRNLQLEPVPDILGTIAPAKGSRIFVGFAAETGNLLEEASRKLVAKKLDLIVANDVARPDSGFESDTNMATLITASAKPGAPVLMTKQELAGRIVQWIESRGP